jgi:hypothetical protein
MNTQKTLRPSYLRAHPDWRYVAHGLDNGQHFVRGDYGYPAPDWSDGRMRVRLDLNNYQERVWIIEAHVKQGAA